MILVIDGHPDRESLCAGLAEAYASGARELGAELELLHLSELRFDPVLHRGYRAAQPLELDLLRAQALLRAAEHLAFFYPDWWGGGPALLKGFVDRVFLPGFAFQPHEQGYGREPLLTGKTGELWLTSDTTRPWFILRAWDTPVRWLKVATLGYCGVSPVTVTTVPRVRGLPDVARWRWLARAKERGGRVARLHRPRPHAPLPQVP